MRSDQRRLGDSRSSCIYHELHSFPTNLGGEPNNSRCRVLLTKNKKNVAGRGRPNGP